MQAAGRRQLALALTFNLPEDDDEVMCAHRNGSSSWSLGVEPVAWEYLQGGEVLLRGGEGADRPTVTAAQGALARVEVSDPVGGGGPGVRSAVEARAQDLEVCYQQALKSNPALDGSLVADIELASGGAPREVRVAVDSLQDEALSTCVRGVLARTTFPRGEARAAIPIHFRLEEPAASGGSGSGR